MFVKDIKAHEFPANRFYPRPKVFLATSTRGWALGVGDGGRGHLRRAQDPRAGNDAQRRDANGSELVDVAVAWEGCDEGDKNVSSSNSGQLWRRTKILPGPSL
jgi:hypothetical protein